MDGNSPTLLDCLDGFAEAYWYSMSKMKGNLFGRIHNVIWESIEAQTCPDLSQPSFV